MYNCVIYSGAKYWKGKLSLHTAKWTKQEKIESGMGKVVELLKVEETIPLFNILCFIDIRVFGKCVPFQYFVADINAKARA